MEGEQFFNLPLVYFMGLQIPSLVQSTIPSPVDPQHSSLKPEPTEKRKYQRTWNRNHIEKLFVMAKEVCASLGKGLEELTETEIYQVALHLKRSPSQCLSKLREVVATGTLRPGTWSPYEDSIISESVTSRKKWGEIAKSINRTIHRGWKVRTGKQCKERWNNHLNPLINKGPWTLEEDIDLILLYLKFGKKWCKISASLPSRTENNIKNRLKSLINVKKQQIDCIEDETTILQELLREKRNSLQDPNN